VWRRFTRPQTELPWQKFAHDRELGVRPGSTERSSLYQHTTAQPRIPLPPERAPPHTPKFGRIRSLSERFVPNFGVGGESEPRSVRGEAFDERLDGDQIVRHLVRTFGSVEQVGQVRRERRALAHCPFDSVGELGRVRGGE
jgi:hypothetical protein